MPFIKYWLIVFLIHVVSANIVTLIKDNNLTCVLTSKTVNAAIYINEDGSEGKLKATFLNVFKFKF